MKALLICMLVGTIVFSASVQAKEHIRSQQLFCLATAVYSEARGEPLAGQIAVAHVVLNRVNSGKYPSSICQVVYQPDQFTDIKQSKPKINSKSWHRSVDVAASCLSGLVVDITDGSTYFYNPSKVRTPNWVHKLQKVVQINNHVFFKE